MKVEAIVVELGKGNCGKFGPCDQVKHDYTHFVDAVADEKYLRIPAAGSCCVDGRNKMGGSHGDGVHSLMQVPGSEVVTNTAGDMMDENMANPILSERVIANTKEVVEDGRVPELHGDDHKHEDGCAANFKMRATLQYAAENTEDVLNTAWAVCSALGLDKKGIAREDAQKAVEMGGKRAEDEKCWDIDCKKVVELAVATLDEGATYDTQLFAQEHLVEGHREELFGVSAGEYMSKTMESALKRGLSEKQAALKVMRGIIYIIGLSKQIGSPDLKIIALKKAA